MSGWRLLSGALLLLAALAAQAQEVPEEARRHMVRGATALQMAKSADELRYAVKEFQEAVRIAPTWAAAWFNLGTVQEKSEDIAGAIASFRKYVELAPQAEDTPKVRDKLIALEYMQERAQQSANLSGTWGRHEIKVEGRQFTAVGKADHYNFIEVFFSGDVEQGARYGALDDRLEGTIQGDTIRGTITRAAFYEEKSGCTIPEDRAEFVGKVNEEGTIITVKYERSKYRADWNGIFWGLEECTGVTRTGSAPITMVFERAAAPKAAEKQEIISPQRGMVGLQVGAGEKGGVFVRSVRPGMPADRAGIKEGDQVVAVDGADMHSATVEEVAGRVRGTAGTSVKVTVVRGDGEPTDYTLVRESFEKLE